MPISAKVSAKFTSAMAALRTEVRTPGSRTRDVMLRRVSDLDAIQNAETFAAQRDPVTGKAWETLEHENKAYAAWKRRNWPGRKLLVWTGRLRDSTRHGKAEGRIARWKGETIQVGTGDKNAIKHQQGETYSTPRVIYLREKRPVPQKDRRDPNRAFRTLGEAAEGAHKPLKPRRWFRLVMRRLPSRPFVGKSLKQAAALRDAMASALIGRWQQVANQAAGTRLLATAAAGRLRVK